MDQAEARERIEKLRTEIEEHNRRYYVLNQPVISDFEYDILINELETLEKSFPEFSTKESPTLTVGSDITGIQAYEISTRCFLLAILIITMSFVILTAV
jgi:DNA ligase (NAD+)